MIVAFQREGFFLCKSLLVCVCVWCFMQHFFSVCVFVCFLVSFVSVLGFSVFYIFFVYSIHFSSVYLKVAFLLAVSTFYLNERESNFIFFVSFVFLQVFFSSLCPLCVFERFIVSFSWYLSSLKRGTGEPLAR